MANDKVTTNPFDAFDVGLNEATFQAALSELGGVPASECTIFHGPDFTEAARALSSRWACSAVEVPGVLLRAQLSWAVGARGRWVYRAHHVRSVSREVAANGE